MPTIALTDTLGLDLEGSLSSSASLLKLLPSFANIADRPLDQVHDVDFSAAPKLAEPIPIPADGLALKLCAGACASFALLDSTRQALDEDDPFDEIPIEDGDLYLSMALKFSLDGKLSGTLGSLSFGFSPDAELELRCYRRFQRGPGGYPTLRKAFAATLASFILPRETTDLDALQPDTVLVLRGAGTLAVSAGVAVAMPTESLACVSLAANQKFQAKADASVGVDANLTISGTYQVRLRRLDGHRAELGVYTLKSREAALSVTAEVGMSATAGPFDLGEKVIGALSPKPAVDVEEFEQLLPGEKDDEKKARITAFQTSIKAGICTKLQLSLGAAIDNLQSREAVWAFEIDTALAVTDQARAAIAGALDGKLGALTRDPKALPAGITQKSNVLTDKDLHKQSLKINVLGLVNLISIGKLAQVTIVKRNASGDVTLITDTSTETRMNALLAIFGKDGKRLRKLLSEDFLITAVYRAGDVGLFLPEFKARHTYLAIDDKTNRDEMKNKLDVVRALNLLSASQADELLGDRRDFGRTAFYAETSYTSDAVRDAFLKPAQQPLSRECYEQIGRQALGDLLSGDEGQVYRKKLVTDDALWHALREDGNRANFPCIFGLPAGTLNPDVEAAGSDFTVILNWAEAMTAAGDALREVDALLGSGTASGNAPDFEKARVVLKQRLAQVVKNTKDEFGEPLGMLMFFRAAGQTALRQARITLPGSPTLALGPTGEIAAKASN